MRARPGDWDLPGGTVEENETDAQGVARELFEETGLVSNNPELLISKGGPWKGVEYTFSYFRIDVNAEQITLSKEHTEYEWHHPLVAAAMVNFTPHRLAIGSLIKE